MWPQGLGYPQYYPQYNAFGAYGQYSNYSQQGPSIFTGTNLRNPGSATPWLSSFLGQHFGPLGAIADAMYIQPAMQQNMSALGMVQGGANQTNLYDTMQQGQQIREYQKVLQETAQMDRGKYARTIRGAMSLAGVPYGRSQAAAVDKWSGIAASLAPQASMFGPAGEDFLESVSGPTGSAPLLASKLFLGGRYRYDPATGRNGMSVESVKALTQKIQDDLYANGTSDAMSGITMGRAGGAYDELTRRGLMGSVDHRKEFSKILREKTGVGPNEDPNLNPEERQEFLKLPEVQSHLRDVDASRVNSTLAKYSKSLGVIQEIFGENGRPDAPMADLFSMLETLTQGGLSEIDPEKLHGAIRTTRNLAQQAGVGLDGVRMLQTMSSGLGKQLGITDPMVAIEAGQQSLAYAGAFQRGGYGAAFGRKTTDQRTQEMAARYTKAAASEYGNNLSAMERAVSGVGGVDPNSQLAEFRKAIDSGSETYEFGGATHRVNLESSHIASLIEKGTGGAVTEAQYRRMLGQTTSNQAYRTAKGTAAVSHEQVRSAKQIVDDQAYSTIRDDLMAKGKTPEEAEHVADQARGKVSAALWAADPSETSTEAGMRKVSGDVIGQIYKDNKFDPKNSEVLGSLLVGNINESMKTRRGQDLLGELDMTRDSLRGSRDQQMRFARQEADNQELVAGLGGRGGILSDIVSGLQTVDIDKPEAMRELLTKSMGGVSLPKGFQDILKQREDAFKEYNELAAQDSDLSADPKDTGDAKKKRSAAIAAQNVVVVGHTRELVKRLNDAGLGRGTISQKSITASETAAKQVEENRTATTEEGKKVLAKNVEEAFGANRSVFDQASVDSDLHVRLGHDAAEKLINEGQDAGVAFDVLAKKTKKSYGELLQGEDSDSEEANRLYNKSQESLKAIKEGRVQEYKEKDPKALKEAIQKAEAEVAKKVGLNQGAEAVKKLYGGELPADLETVAKGLTPKTADYLESFSRLEPEEQEIRDVELRKALQQTSPADKQAATTTRLKAIEQADKKTDKKTEQPTEGGFKGFFKSVFGDSVTPKMPAETTTSSLGGNTQMEKLFAAVTGGKLQATLSGEVAIKGTTDKVSFSNVTATMDIA